MIEIDGSYGEGGGQIVRTSVALSAVTGMPVHITRIRQGRPRPGLAPQHVQAISALAKLCRAKTAGVTPRSTEISFLPGDICPGDYRVDIGTAGSVTLLMQCLLPAMLRADAAISLEVTGGTDVSWSPTIDYFSNVFLPALSKFGAKVNLTLRRRGYYPQGQGLVLLQVKPGSLKAADFTPEVSGTIAGRSHCSNLPEHVALRQAEAAASCLLEAGYESVVDKEVLSLPSVGSGISLWHGHKGGSALGKRGLPAEKVGRTAAQEIITELKSPCSVDVHLADQLIPYLALAGGSFTVREISMHARTNIGTAGHFLERKISIAEAGVFKVEAEQL
jgi:RNA 3'-terminal phosphate cyclase (ATP)